MYLLICLRKFHNNPLIILLIIKYLNILNILFIKQNLTKDKLDKKLEAKWKELHTGKISNKIKGKKNYINELEKIKKCAKLGNLIGLEIHAGHGMDYKTAKILSKIKEIKEFNIGHFLIGESIFNGFKNVIRKFQKLMKS